MAQHNDLGTRGEDIAEKYLMDKGYRIIERNWTDGRHEIDIIATNEDFVVFVEVKTRASDRWGHPEEAVSDTKIRRIVEAADSYLSEQNEIKSVRFDVVAVIINDQSTNIDHIEDAFFAPLN